MHNWVEQQRKEKQNKKKCNIAQKKHIQSALACTGQICRRQTQGGRDRGNGFSADSFDFL